jgi:hypothetical protein
VGQLETAVAPGTTLQGPVVDAALALASGAEVAVLVGLEDLAAPERARAEALAGALAERGMAVLLVVGEAGPPPTSGEQVLVGSAGATYTDNGSGGTHE